MTKKDYIKIAALLKQAHVDQVVVQYDVEVIARRFADMLAQDNAAFDRQRFLEATR